MTQENINFSTGRLAVTLYKERGTISEKFFQQFVDREMLVYDGKWRLERQLKHIRDVTVIKTIPSAFNNSVRVIDPGPVNVLVGSDLFKFDILNIGKSSTL